MSFSERDEQKIPIISEEEYNQQIADSVVEKPVKKYKPLQKEVVPEKEDKPVTPDVNDNKWNDFFKEYGRKVVPIDEPKKNFWKTIGIILIILALISAVGIYGYRTYMPEDFQNKVDLVCEGSSMTCPPCPSNNCPACNNACNFPENIEVTINNETE